MTRWAGSNSFDLYRMYPFITFRRREEIHGEHIVKTADLTNQRTLKTEIGCTGVALHSGRKTSLTLKPAEENTGIRICRTDLFNGAREIIVNWQTVVDTRLATTVGNDHGATVGTIEHLIAALAGCEIDNILIEVDGPEIPIMDGSAAPFVFLIECAGVLEQNSDRRGIKILKTVAVGNGQRSLSISPSEEFSLDFEIGFDTSAIDCQERFFARTGENFKSDIARARTFGFEREVNAMRDAGLALGGSLQNAVVIGDQKILNEEGLRYGDEFVRHKILDCIGDLYLAGGPVIGAVRASRSGHALNNELLQAIFADDTAWKDVKVASNGKAINI
ncbi:MAG: UDP-3-O-acyl-N-acetylglucosamine deacetylase [Pseudomonadota bacterium]|nr:UDP-3-O-acyl-N-acetylglucosamine deacetylase [Pseudomonadota bacterium]